MTTIFVNLSAFYIAFYIVDTKFILLLWSRFVSMTNRYSSNDLNQWWFFKKFRWQMGWVCRAFSKKHVRSTDTSEYLSITHDWYEKHVQEK